MNFKDIIARKKGFTIVEILVVIAVVGILASISVVGYGAWKKSASTAQVKSDLNAAAAAMENARTFNNAYPATLPGTVTPSNGVVLSGGSTDSGKTYCVDGSSLDDTTIVFYVDSVDSEKGAQIGTCATRPNLPAPTVPGNLAVVSSAGTQVNLSWNASANTISYTAQCASDPSFSLGLQESTHTTLTGSVSGLTLSSSYYCRVKAVNNTGSSSWSSRVSTATNDAYGSLAVATSIEGYWTTAPQGFLLEDGSEVSRTTYSSLFAVIGTTYGAGDGTLTFNLPDSRGRTTVNRNASDPEFATIGQVTGSKTEALTIAQLPIHTHIQDIHNHTQVAHDHSQNSHAHTQPAHAHAYSINQGNAQFSVAGGTGMDNRGSNNATTSSATPTINGATATNIATTATNNAATATNQNAGSGSTHNNIQPSIVKMSAIKYSPVDLTATQLPAGSSIQGYWSTAPSGYVLEDGAAYSRTDPSYAPLYAAISTTYGIGDGSTTFNVPDSRGRASANKSSTDTEFDVMGEKPGSKTEILTLAQIASHTHTQNSHTHTQNSHNHTQNAHSHTQVAHSHNYSTNLGNAQFTYAGGTGMDLKGVNNITTTSATPVINGTAANNQATTPTNNATTATNQDAGSGSGHNTIQPSIVKMSAIKRTAQTGTGQTTATGTSVGGYWTSVPSGYLLEDGAEVSRTTYSQLFSVIGTTYGAGNGSTTFNLPDSRGRLGVNKSPTDTEFDVMGEKTGSKAEILTLTQLASHTHIQNSHNHTQNSHNHTQDAHSHTQVAHTHAYSTNATNAQFSTAGGTGMDVRGTNNATTTSATPTIDGTTATNIATTATNNAVTATNQNNGGGGSHNNIQPSIVKMFIIKY